MSKQIQAIRGMNDTIPDDSPYWQYVETVCRQVVDNYNYKEIRFPIVEQTALFKRSIGEVTDIVEKEMYTFDDRNGDSLTLRPEGTACCVRAALQNGLLHNQIQRLWYMGPMFRHERPQKGRYRQFYQLGIETFGISEPEADVEVILLSKRLFETLGLLDGLELQINTIGTKEAREVYRKQLVTYYESHHDKLDEDSQRRLKTNPLRILDSKNPEIKKLNEAAPKFLDYLDEVSEKHFARTCELLDALGVAYTVTPTLVRGLDYYCHTVFEWVTTELGAQGTVCAGGRYDYLVEQLGGKPMPAIGFAMGLERIILLLKEKQDCQQHPDVFFVLLGNKAMAAGMQLAERLRDTIPGISIETNCKEASFKSQFKRADKSGADYAVIIGEDEAAKGVAGLKNLREGGEQQELSFDELTKGQWLQLTQV
jgi:histidyl-tRNA synthetase